MRVGLISDTHGLLRPQALAALLPVSVGELVIERKKVSARILELAIGRKPARKLFRTAFQREKRLESIFRAYSLLWNE